VNWPSAPVFVLLLAVSVALWCLIVFVGAVIVG
jgi:hypothetical protein